jgi:hypothetical protein
MLDMRRGRFGRGPPGKKSGKQKEKLLAARSPPRKTWGVTYQRKRDIVT